MERRAVHAARFPHAAKYVAIRRKGVGATELCDPPTSAFVSCSLASGQDFLSSHTRPKFISPIILLLNTSVSTISSKGRRICITLINPNICFVHEFLMYFGMENTNVPLLFVIMVCFHVVVRSSYLFGFRDS